VPTEYVRSRSSDIKNKYFTLVAVTYFNFIVGVESIKKNTLCTVTVPHNQTSDLQYMVTVTPSNIKLVWVQK